MLFACGLRIAGADDSSFDVRVVSVLPWLLAPSLPLLVLSLLRRKRCLAAIAAISLLAAVAWEAPVMWPIARAPSPGTNFRLLLFDANVAQDNYDLTGIASEIARDRPDLVTLEELTPLAADSLRRSGVLSGYQWSLIRPERGAGGMGVWSKIPAIGLRVWMVPPDQVEIDGWIQPSGAPAVRLDAVHVYAPVGTDEPARWINQLARVRVHLSREPKPLIVAGDFNATTDDRPFQRILGLGLSDAAVLAGDGWEMTWPRNQAWVIPYVRIDHILLSKALTVTGYRLGTGKGSDHFPVVVDLAFRAR